MGLDMYLKAEQYVGGWDHSDKEETALFKQLTQVAGTDKLVASGSPSVTVSTNVAYWRKANAIHAWFVRELAEGKDECQKTYVSVENMEKLIAECQAALKLYDNGCKEEAGKSVPPQGGFFFGSTEIDEWWANDLRDTIAQLTPLVDPEVSKKFEYYYQASW